MYNQMIKNKNVIIEILLDIVIFGVSYFLAFFLKMEGNFDRQTALIFRATLPLVVLVRIITFYTFKVFSGQWQYCSISDVILIFKAISVGSIIMVLIFHFLNHISHFPRSIFILDWMIVTLLIGIMRFSHRLTKEIMIGRTNKIRKILIVGAGRVGKSLINEMKSNWEMGYQPVAIVDDDVVKLNKSYYGVRVFGNRMSIPHLVSTMKIDEIVIALPHVSGKDIREIVNLCRISKRPFKIVTNSLGPTDQKDITNRIRNLNIEDIIGRRQTEIDFQEIREFISGKRVLVTGAAGSIGSELCRQIADFNPEKLILLDRSENGLFYLERELSEKYQELDYSLALADVTDKHELDVVFSQYKPHVVFHAAAYKHVPMMELHPAQAVKNNIIGTKLVVDTSIQHNVQKFVLISTDKAVNPENVMGMTKRIAEQYVQALNETKGISCVAVRFGNVLGSSGSVLRLFQEQITKGGPVTVTHPDVARFFMTIPEAVQLVLQAATLGNGGEIFVLKMGELVKIKELAKEMILLSGKQPNTEIKIKYTGLRPGEKITEELWENSEECTEDFNENLYVIRNGHINNVLHFEKNLKNLLQMTSTPNTLLKSKLMTIVNNTKSIENVELN